MPAPPRSRAPLSRSRASPVASASRARRRHPSVIHPVIHPSVPFSFFPFSLFPSIRNPSTRPSNITHHTSRDARDHADATGEIRACARTGHPDESRSANQSPPPRRANDDADDRRDGVAREWSTRGRRRADDDGEVTPSSIPRRASRVETRRPGASARRERDPRRGRSSRSRRRLARDRSFSFIHSRIHSFIHRAFVPIDDDRRVERTDGSRVSER